MKKAAKEKKAPKARKKSAKVPTPEVVVDAVTPETSPPAPALAQKKVVPTVTVPSTWKDDGYLLLVHDEEHLKGRPGAVPIMHLRWLSTRTGEAHHGSPENFLSKVSRPAPEINVVHFSLNLLLRSRSGLMPLRVRDERKLVTMLSKEELLKLSERELARSYSTIMGVKGPERIKGAAREKAIEEMIAKATSDAAKASDEATNGTGAKKVRTPKAPKEKKVKVAKEKKVREPKPPKEKKVKVDLQALKAGENPYRAGCMKAVGFDYYVAEKAKTSDEQKLRDKCIAALVKGGAKEASAKSWYAGFLKVKFVK